VNISRLSTSPEVF